MKYFVFVLSAMEKYFFYFFHTVTDFSDLGLYLSKTHCP